MFGRKLKKLKEEYLNNLREVDELIEQKNRLLNEREKMIDKQLTEIKKLKKALEKKEQLIKDLETEREFLFNNLTPKKRELINADKQK